MGNSTFATDNNKYPEYCETDYGNNDPNQASDINENMATENDLIDELNQNPGFDLSDSDTDFGQFCDYQDHLISECYKHGDDYSLRKLQYSSAEDLRSVPTPQWKRDRLRLARERVPRFLFRVFGDKSGGGLRGLNGKHGITPHGFLPEDQRLGHHRRYCVCMRNERSTAFTMTEADFSDMVLNHISGEPDPDTESSSWGASLEVVFWFQDFSVQQRPKSLHLATLDTWAFPDNEVFDVHHLWRAGLIWDWNPPEQTAEYLVHGRINVGVPGYGYYCRRIDDLKSFQLDPLLIKCLSYDSKWPHYGSTLYGKRRRNRNASAETLRRHTRSAVKVASAMLNGFSRPDVDAALIYMFAALLGVRFGREDR